MTAPRKPVAWMEPGTCNAYSDEDFQRYRHETPEFAKWLVPGLHRPRPPTPVGAGGEA
jgi:hypothetical protein